jgi:hypothetical protein
MAIRKFIFFNGTEGYSQEQATNDELSLGKVTLSGVSGVSLDVGGGDIANLGAPTGANSAARKAYVDSGLATEAAARAADVATVTAAITAEATARASADTTLQTNITAEATARIAADAALQAEIDAEETARAGAVTTLTSSLSAEQAARIAADTALQSGLSAEATARANADTALQAEIDAEEIARAAAVTTLTTGLNAEQAARIAADNLLATNYAAADAALSTSLTSAYQAADAQIVSQMQAYADSLQAGFSVKAPVMAIATGNITLSGTQTIDGVSLVAGNRVLVAGQTSGAENGIYVVASGAWARSADADSSSEVKDGMSVFVEQGTSYGNSTWVLITNNAITLGATALEFVRFSGLGQITAGNGLAQSGNELSVNTGNGIQIVADAVAAKVQTSYGLSVDGDGVRVDLAALKGLEFSGGDLAVKLESDAGIDFDASNGGLELKLVSADRLTKSASGLDVTGLPSAFKLDGVAVNAGVTAARLTELVTGWEPVGYHYHNNQKQLVYLAAGDNVALSVGTALYAKGGGSDGLVGAAKADCTDAEKSRVIGVASVMTPGGAAGTSLQMFTSGYVSGLSGLTANTAYYVGSSGAPVTYAAVPAGARVIRLGHAVSATELMLAIQDMGQKA